MIDFWQFLRDAVIIPVYGCQLYGSLAGCVRSLLGWCQYDVKNGAVCFPESFHRHGALINQFNVASIKMINSTSIWFAI